MVYGAGFPGLLIRFLMIRDLDGVGKDTVCIVTEYPFQFCKVDFMVILL